MSELLTLAQRALLSQDTLGDDDALLLYWHAQQYEGAAPCFVAPRPLFAGGRAEVVVAPALPAPGFICEVCFDAMATTVVPATDRADAYGACEDCLPLPY